MEMGLRTSGTVDQHGLMMEISGAQHVTLSVEDFKLTEQGSLRLDLPSIADDNKLQVRGIQIFSGAGQ